ncbi:NYN domain-containing protein [Aquihabitans sp. McL0605]|uniref:NYN domain-containing protein n=1 Tax=Aquihabitans sp. McL0605 TaxID=3415671 RepID=UPI003CF1B5F5
MKTALHPPQRAMHLLDIEYLVGGPAKAEGADVQGLVTQFRSTAEWHGNDLMIGAASHWCYQRLAFDMPSDVRFLPAGGGPDAADLQLLGEIDPVWVAERADRVVVGSGDHIFEDLIIDLRNEGVEVWAVGHRHNMARRLQMVADEVRFLPFDPDPAVCLDSQVEAA